MRRWLSEYGAGLVLGVRAMVAKEMRARSRGWRPMWLLTLYLVILTVGFVGMLGLIGGVGGTVYATMGMQTFSTLVVGSVLMLAFITPALTVGAVSGERERRTLDLLLVTRTSALGLVTGKLLASLVYILYLLIASLPAFAVVYLFGGVPWQYLVLALAVAAVTAVTHAALGLLLSAVLRRTALASVVAYLVVLFLVFGMPFGVLVSGVASYVSPTAKPGASSQASLPPVYLYASPLVSAGSVLPEGTYLPFVGSLLGLSRMGVYASVSSSMAMPPIPIPMSTGQATSIAQTVFVTGSNPLTGEPQTVTTWAPWVYHFGISTVIVVLCVLGAGLAATPVKPWQTWRARRRARPAPSEVRTT